MVGGSWREAGRGDGIGSDRDHHWEDEAPGEDSSQGADHEQGEGAAAGLVRRNWRHDEANEPISGKVGCLYNVEW